MRFTTKKARATTARTGPRGVPTALQRFGFAHVSARELSAMVAVSSRDLRALQRAWERLPIDHFLRDGGQYRRRRHSCFTFTMTGGALELQPHRAHWQPTTYNALHGGIERLFEPMRPAMIQSEAFRALLCGLSREFASIRPVKRWYIEAHQFRIDTARGIGRPTPEGAHRDGVDFVCIILMRRCDIQGGETRVFDARGSTGMRFTMAEPASALLLDDRVVIHETTPIRPLDADRRGHRDTLVLTFRRHGFQAPRRS